MAAAFIGPGTVTVCTLAGVKFGHALLWTMVLSVMATIVLQETAARIGLVTKKGLSQVLRDELKKPVAKVVVLSLVMLAIVLGNAAYEAGNISGGILGLQVIGGSGNVAVFGNSINLYSLLIGAIAFILLIMGSYRVVERVLVILVIFMSISFLITAFLVEPDWYSVLKNSVVPTIPAEGLLTVIALVGTTVVPYNLFLHASLVNQKWNGIQSLQMARRDTVIALVLGGLVSMSIVIAASSINSGEVKNITDLAKALEPLYGSGAKYFIALGLFAAGLTSAITAPLAAAYVAQGCFGWGNSISDRRFRLVWMVVLLTGVLFATLGINPIQIIQFAQIANGILLPLIAGILIWLANRAKLLGKYSNSTAYNFLSIGILLLTLLLGIRSVFKVLNIW